MTDERWCYLSHTEVLTAVERAEFDTETEARRARILAAPAPRGTLSNPHNDSEYARRQEAIVEMMGTE